MDLSQATQFVEFLKTTDITEFHHGDCIGADAEAHHIVRTFFPHVKIIGHPPVNESKRAFCTFDEVRPADEYLVRNRAIVMCSDLLVATPGEAEEQLRSGTWSTVRYARHCEIPVKILVPGEPS